MRLGALLAAAELDAAKFVADDRVVDDALLNDPLVEDIVIVSGDVSAGSAVRLCAGQPGRRPRLCR